MRFAMSVHLFIHMEQLGSHQVDFYDTGYLSIFRKFVNKIHVSLKSDKSNGYFMCIPIYIFDHILLSS